MSKCYSRWQGRIVRPAGKPMHWEMECGTCKLKLENGQVPKSCGLSAFENRRAAIRMGSLNSKLWEARERLSQLQTSRRTVPINQIKQFEIRQAYLRGDIWRLMLEKRNPKQYAELVKWDEMLKQDSKIALI